VIFEERLTSRSAIAVAADMGLITGSEAASGLRLKAKKFPTIHTSFGKKLRPVFHAVQSLRDLGNRRRRKLLEHLKTNYKTLLKPDAEKIQIFNTGQGSTVIPWPEQD